MKTETPVDFLAKAVNLAGGQSALAAELTKRGAKQISAARVWNWINRDGGPPPEFGALIEEIVDGQVTRKQMFPDTWHIVWPELAVPSHGAVAGQGA